MGGTKIFVLQMRQIRKILLIAAAALAALLIVLFLFGGRSAQSPAAPTAPPPAIPAAPRQQQPPPAGPGAQAVTPVGNFVPGTYYSEIVLSNSTILVSVEVSENAILNISISEPYEAQEVFYPLMQPTLEIISQQIVQTQSLNVQTSGETPYTQEVLISAIRSALDAARR
ncbi:MAG: hypothetical protein FWE20_06935 [Defluviitaleaceae bacterium]|nr:hypothetical protein [Defluviitaleaceae bacterium]